jgi:UDP-2,3-diacylglucosamine pyrophosphatase LpxH
MSVKPYRAVFVSDIHLGTPDCQADYLLSFLSELKTQRLYLVGDIIDLYAMRRRITLTPVHEKVISQILHMAATGTEVIYIPGNHDAPLRRFCGQTIAHIKLQRDAVHVTADGRCFFVSHGDEFDSVMQCSAWLTRIGDLSHELLLRLNTLLNLMRRHLSLPYWSFSSYVKSRIGRAARFIANFEGVAAQRAGEQAFDGYICGHIHRGNLKYEHGVLYCNDGDWVEHCTALVEDSEGCLSLIHRSDVQYELIRETELRGPEIEPVPLPGNPNPVPGFVASRGHTKPVAIATTCVTTVISGQESAQSEQYEAV